MKVYETANIRNVAVVGHGGCGKTSLVSAMLFDMGAVNRLGRVDDGTTVTDFDPDEIERKISLQTALAYGEWRKTKINLLDAPGYANFLVRGALRPARGRRRAWWWWTAWPGSRCRREKVWGYAEDYGLPRLIVVEPDGPRPRLVRAHAGVAADAPSAAAVVPLAIPLGEEKGFVGVADLVNEQGRRLRATTRAASSRRWTCPPEVRGRGRQPGARSWSRWSRRATRT